MMRIISLLLLVIAMDIAAVEIPAGVLADPVLTKAEYMSYATAFRRLAEADMDVDDSWCQHAVAADFDAFRRRVRENAVTSFGGFPERTALNARITGCRELRGYRLEKVVFESLPGFHVTACVYVPTDPRFKPPYAAVVVPCGHTEGGKGGACYQYPGIMLARAGFVAAVFDPIDQGERRQVPDHGRCGAGHNALGALEMLLGRSGLRTRLWDAMRVTDYLQSRSDVDGSRIGAMGVSGGGTMSAMLAAFDDRIRAVAPACYISSLRRVVADCGPQDSEQIIFGQLGFGLNHLGLLLLRAPTPTLVCAAHDDFFPIEGVLQTTRAVKSIAEKRGWSQRYALVEASGKHDWTQGMLNASVDWMRRWLDGRTDVTAPNSSVARIADTEIQSAMMGIDDVLDERETFATKSGNVAELPGNRSIFKVISDDLDEILSKRPRRLPADTAKAAVRLAGIRSLATLGFKTVDTGRMATNGCQVTKLAFVDPDGFTMAGVLVVPDGELKGVPVLYAGEKGRSAFAAEVSATCAAKRPALVVDLEGFGEIGVTKKRIHVGSCVWDGLGKIHYLLGKSLVGRRAEQLLVAANELRSRFGHSPELIAVGKVVIPAAHAHAADPQLLPNVVRREVPPSWTEAIRRSVSEPIQWTFTDSVQGALLAYDWAELF